jgi:hypothetical protein
MLDVAIGKLIHEERQREIERVLEARRLLETTDDTDSAVRRSSREADSERRLRASGHEAAGAAS